MSTTPSSAGSSSVYEDLDAGRRSEVKGWGSRESALKTIEKAREQFLLAAVRG